MKFIIFISDNIRHGNFPRVDGFSFCAKYGKYLYLGRPLTDDEFNVAAKRVFSPDFRDQGFHFCPAVLAPEFVTFTPLETPDAAADNLPVPDAAADNLPVPDAAADPVFVMEGKNIFVGEVRVAGLYGEDNHLRVKADHSDMRPAIEAWLESQPTQ
jgi:hypothetical protein